MRNIFLLGFPTSCQRQLHERMSAEICRAGTVIFIPQVSEGREADLVRFKSRILGLDAAATTSKILLPTAPEPATWFLNAVDAICAERRLRCPQDLVEFAFAVPSPDVLLEHVLSFGPTVSPEISIDLLRRKLRGEKVLCLRSTSQSSFQDVFKREGIPTESWDDHFAELQLNPGKNSNLIQEVTNRAQRYSHLLYAWSGLRTLPSDVKRRFTGIRYEAPTTVKVVRFFRRWLLSDGDH